MMGLMNLNNKLKGRVRQLTPSWILLVFAAAVLICVPLRLYQTICLIEPETGFFVAGDHASVTVLYVVAAVAGAAILVMSYLGIRPDVPDRRIKSRALCVMAAVMAAAFLIDAFYTIYTIVRSAVEYSAAAGMDGGGRYAVMQFITQGAQVVLAMLSCIYFACLSFSWNGRGTASLYAVLAVMPVFWAIACAVNRFIRMINFKNVSDLLLELFMLAFMMLFFLAFARVNSRVESEGVRWQLYGCGLAAALAAAIVNVPRLIMILCGLGGRIADGYPLNVCGLVFPFFMVAYLLYISAGSREDGAEQEYSTLS